MDGHEQIFTYVPVQISKLETTRSTYTFFHMYYIDLVPSTGT